MLKKVIIIASISTLSQCTDVYFSFKKEPIIALINRLAEQKKISVLYPPGAGLELLKKQVVSLDLTSKKELPIEQAWSLVKTFLEMSGFSLVQTKPTFYKIVHNATIEGGAINREVLPIYIGTPATSLPTDDSRIRYLFYFKSMPVPSLQERETSPLYKMMKELLSKDAQIIFDAAAKAVLITDRASKINFLVSLLATFEKMEKKEAIIYVPIEYVPNKSVVAVFEALKKASGDTDSRGYNFIRSDTESEDFTTFTRDTKIIADPSKNGIIIMGRENHIERIADFIREMVDRPPEKGTSILHAYDLCYLDATTFAPALEKVITALTQAPDAQRQQEKPFAYGFRGAYVIAESVTEPLAPPTSEAVVVEQLKGIGEIKGIDATIKGGGNRLIIAARNAEWRVIKQLLDQLDKPDLQVILEIVIADFTYDATNTLAGDIAIPPHDPHSGVQLLASHITPVSPLLGPTPAALVEDLLATVAPNDFSNSLPVGSLLFSFNSPRVPGIFGLIDLLRQVIKTNIVSYPFITVTNHKVGSIESTTYRRVTGNLITSTVGAFVIPIEDLPATVKVVTKPYIVSEDRVRLDIAFIQEQYEGATLNRLTREMQTTATLASGQIFVMGGLIQTAVTDNETLTPLLGRIPIANLFFKGRTKELIKTNLTLFISPTIIRPRSKTATEKTADLTCFAETEGIFSERDPIYRTFLKDRTQDYMQRFLSESSNLEKAECVDGLSKKRVQANLARLQQLLSEHDQIVEFDPGKMGRFKSVGTKLTFADVPLDSGKLFSKVLPKGKAFNNTEHINHAAQIK